MGRSDRAERAPAGAAVLARGLQDDMARLVAGAAPGAVAGIGVDVVEIATFAALPLAEHAAFYALTFSADEIAYCQGRAYPAQHFAARFAAKEAVVKACGELVALTPAQVAIAHARTGAPVARLRGAPALGDGYAIHVSLGHSDTIAYAVALVVRREEASVVAGRG